MAEAVEVCEEKKAALDGDGIIQKVVDVVWSEVR